MIALLERSSVLSRLVSESLLKIGKHLLDVLPWVFDKKQAKVAVSYGPTLLHYNQPIAYPKIPGGNMGSLQIHYSTGVSCGTSRVRKLLCSG